ncbi:unnamed protein product [Prorocentrum cordatum]|uniref:ER lumen protein-retaining receptor n=1 Tax=Prorocentrum cordatum TaxID=2364126 RepID=A0ABN9W7P0_9DINO|nr:unnamed protein product [Polarella glacialis]
MWVIDWAKSHPQAAALYTCFAVGVLVVYRTLTTKATGEYDYILTLSAALQTLAFGLLDFDTKSNVGEGLSEKTLVAFLLAHMARTSTTFTGEGYIPEDNTADVYLYQLLEVAGVAFLAHKLNKVKAARSMNQIAQGVERWSLVGSMVGLALALGYFTKSTGHNQFWMDWAWMASVWLEAFALFPQVYLLISAAAPYVDDTAVHFAGLTLSASGFFALFWGRAAKDRYNEFEKTGEHLFFIAIMGAVMVRVTLCSAYFYVFMKTSRGHKGALVSSGKGEYELCMSDDQTDFDEL